MVKTLMKVISGLFKPSIHKLILKNWNNGAKNLHINIFFKNQVLFQVMPARHFIDRGIELSNENDMIIIHFFNKNKTITFEKLEKFKSKIFKKGFIEFETKQNSNFVRNVGNDPKLIENEIYKDIELYSLREYEKENIKIEFMDFKERKK